MSLTRETKQQVITDYRRHEKDSGSPEVQIAVLSAAIAELTEHMKRHPKDHASRHGLLQKVSRRTRLMNYLRRTEPNKYTEIAARLGLRK
ncbi:MAG: 30S ribosomal protein S15 [Planctomycetota bacterium]